MPVATRIYEATTCGPALRTTEHATLEEARGVIEKVGAGAIITLELYPAMGLILNGHGMALAMGTVREPVYIETLCGGVWVPAPLEAFTNEY